MTQKSDEFEPEGGLASPGPVSRGLSVFLAGVLLGGALGWQAEGVYREWGIQRVEGECTGVVPEDKRERCLFQYYQRACDLGRRHGGVYIPEVAEACGKADALRDGGVR